MRFVFSFSRFQREPAIVWFVVLNKGRTESDMAEESFPAGAVVNRDVDFGMLANDITTSRVRFVGENE